MTKLTSVCVYCGSKVGDDPAFVQTAKDLGKTIAARGLRLVYGGASIGIMGCVAKATQDAGGKVTGVIPRFLKKLEPHFPGLDEQIETETMHERKQIMFERSDAFIVLPGGIGTLEETVEMLTWRQLSRHKRPIVFVNINGYWDPFIELLQHVVDRSFSGPGLLDYFVVVDKSADIIPAIEKMMPSDQEPELDGATIDKM